MIRKLHLYVALIFGVVFSLLGLTGSWLAFYPELDSQLLRFDTRLPQAGAISWDRVMEAADHAVGESNAMSMIQRPSDSHRRCVRHNGACDRLCPRGAAARFLRYRPGRLAAPAVEIHRAAKDIEIMSDTQSNIDRANIDRANIDRANVERAHVERANVDLVRQLLSGPPPDAAGLAAFAEQWLHAEITLSYPGAAPIAFAGVWRGRQGTVDFMTTFHSLVEIEHMQVSSFAGAADEVFVRGVTRGRVRSTGKSYVSEWLLIWTVKDGRIARMVEYHDTQAIANAFA